MSDQKSDAGKGWVFNLNDDDQGIHRKLAEGITTRIFVGTEAMISVVRVEPGTAGKLHSHVEEHGACFWKVNACVSRARKRF